MDKETIKERILFSLITIIVMVWFFFLFICIVPEWNLWEIPEEKHYYVCVLMVWTNGGYGK